MWERAVFIPACREWELLPGSIKSLASIAPPRTLLVIVLNAREDAEEQTHTENQQIFSWLSQFPHEKKESDLWFFSYPNLDIYLIDRWTPPFRMHSKQGVGTARALGSEFICTLYSDGILLHPWIWSTDADARFASDYLDVPTQKGTCILPYVHTGTTIDEPAPLPLAIYEYSLRYYALGLHHAQSPFAYPTIGSTILISIDTYQKSHGFPHRMAGEDFYLLAKASKVAPVTYLKRAPIHLISRESDRVPFGTGQGMASIASAGCTKELYHPNIFIDLARWIHTLNTASDEDLLAQLREIAPHFAPLNKLPALLSQKAKGTRIITRRHEWFDAFRTLKWVHHMRDSKWGTLPYKEALHMAEFVALSSDENNWAHELREQEERCITAGGIPLLA